MFQYLYVQTEYSILQSSCKIKPLIEKLKNQNAYACSITDEKTMYGTIKFYQECISNHMKPIIGLKVEMVYNDLHNNLILYAINNFGYQNLMKISSRMMLNSDRVVDYEYLQKASMGILAILPYEESFIKRYLQHRNEKEALHILHILKETYDLLYIGIGIQTKLNSSEFIYLKNLFYENQFQLVALPKVSFLEENDFDAYITLRSILNNGILIKEEENERLNYVHDIKEIEDIYHDEPTLIDNTMHISKICQVEIIFGQYQLPLYQDGLDSFTYLKELCQKGLDKRIQSFTYQYDKIIYLKRLYYELDVIQEMGFCDYFLIVYDYVKFSKKSGLYVGPGRGSAPASLVAYTLGITDIDPIYHNLLFERFLNRERISMPDIDIDFPDDRRDEVIRYVGKKYGKEKVAHIVTFGTFRIKQAINDCARVYKLSEVKVKEIYKNLPNVNSNTKENLKDLIEENTQLNILMDENDDIRKVLEIACVIQDIPRNISTHAAGIVMTRFDLIHYTPLDEGLDDIYQTQYEAKDLESLGLLKMDFLGLKNLTNISKTIELIKIDYPEFVLPRNEEDSDTYEMMRHGDLTGVFQLESAGMRKVIMQLQTSCFDDITHALALYRPGPMDNIPRFIQRKLGEEKVTYPHSDLEEILKETYGMIVYQDQIMLVARKFAGYSLGRADILRRAVSKKKKEVLENERVHFVQSSIDNGYSKNVANQIYDYIVKFADYGFNKAHSVAYAKVAYLTAYLKCHFFPYYMSTLMTTFMGSAHEIAEYIKETLRKKIEIVVPDINLSDLEFRVIHDKIYFPLTMIRGLGEIKTKECLEERKKGIFTDFENFIYRTSHIFSIPLFENIIYSGALDGFGLTKKAMIDNLKSIIDKSSYGFIKDIINTTYTTEEYSYGVLQEKEKEIFGFNLKYNFFRQFSHLYQTYHLLRIDELKENCIIETIGMIKRIKEIKTKQNKTMAFLELVDDTSTIEMVLFPDVYDQYPNLKIGMIVIVKGNTQRRTSLQIIASQLKQLS